MKSTRAKAHDEKIVAEAIAHAAACHGQGLLQQADTLYARLLKVRPNHFHLLYLFGLLRLQQGRHPEAMSLFARALKIAPDSADLLANRALALGALGQWQEALASCERSLALAPDR